MSGIQVHNVRHFSSECQMSEWPSSFNNKLLQGWCQKRIPMGESTTCTLGTPSPPVPAAPHHCCPGRLPGLGGRPVLRPGYGSCCLFERSKQQQQQQQQWYVMEKKPKVETKRSLAVGVKRRRRVGLSWPLGKGAALVSCGGISGPPPPVVPWGRDGGNDLWVCKQRQENQIRNCGGRWGWTHW